MTDTTREASSQSQLLTDDMPNWKRERQQRIIRAALELLEASDYDRIQIRDVAERADFALGTIYRYFNSKEHLYAAVMVEWARSFERHIHRKRPTGDAADRLKQVTRRVIKAFERHPQFLRLEIILESSNDEYARATFQEFVHRNQGSYLEALDDIPRDIAAQIILAVNNVLATQLRRYSRGRTTIDEVDRVTTSVIDLIFSPPPRPTPSTSQRTSRTKAAKG